MGRTFVQWFSTLWGGGVSIQICKQTSLAESGTFFFLHREELGFSVTNYSQPTLQTTTQIFLLVSLFDASRLTSRKWRTNIMRKSRMSITSFVKGRQKKNFRVIPSEKLIPSQMKSRRANLRVVKIRK